MNKRAVGRLFSWGDYFGHGSGLEMVRIRGYFWVRLDRNGSIQSDTISRLKVTRRSNGKGSCFCFVTNVGGSDEGRTE